MEYPCFLRFTSPASLVGLFQRYDCFNADDDPGSDVPVFDITQEYESGDLQDMLVNSIKLGAALASNFVESSQADPTIRGGNGRAPAYNVVLMQNHGFTTHGTSIQQAVYRAVYTHMNAGVQSTAIILRNAHVSNSGREDGAEAKLRYLNPAQVIGCQDMNDRTQERPWGLWEREVAASPLYINKA